MGRISSTEFITAISAMAGQSVRTATDGNNSSRTKSAIAAATPTFGGDLTDSTTAGHWINSFERVAMSHGLERTEWPMQAVLSFPLNSAAALWADSIFGPGLWFNCESWDVFRSGFLCQYTPSSALITAQASFEQLSQEAYGEDIMAFSREFNIWTLQFDAGLRNAGHQGLSPDDLVRAFHVGTYPCYW
jgi:hypothetical protein